MSGVAVWAGVALLGGSGSVLRVLVDEAVRRRVDGHGTPGARGLAAFPLGIFVVNVSGSLVAGVLAGLALGPDAALLALTGFVGSYTTFSTWMLDAVTAAAPSAHGRSAADVPSAAGGPPGSVPSAAGWRAAAANVGLSLAVGFAAAAVGHALGTAL